VKPLVATGPRRPGRALLPIVAIVLAAALAAGKAAAQAPDAPPRLLDDFADLSSWHAGASDGVRASIHAADGIDGRALELDFDLAGTAGYAVAERALPLDLPSNYEISFYVRADAPVNNFQFKLTDAAGDNVWWFNQPNFTFPREWRQVRIRKRQIEFAWGPTTDRSLTHAARLELVVAAGRDGGAGTVRFSRLEVRALPPVPAIWPAPAVHASSDLPGADPARTVDGQLATAWHSDPGKGPAQSLTLDFGQRREFGGIVLHWLDKAFASRYEVQVSDDDVQWRTLRSVSDGSGGNDALALPGAESRYLRLLLQDGPARTYGLAEVEIKDPAFGESANAFIEVVARNSPRGYFPRGFSGEQAYWTLVGVDGGDDSALLSTDGALEAGRGGFSIEPFVVAAGKLTTWAEADAQPFLPDGYLPMPGVRWRQPQWELSVSSFAAGTQQAPRIVAQYQITNLTGGRLPLQLVLALRPFQVNPPTQFLSTVGGISAIRDIAWDGTAFSVNEARKVYALQAPDKVGAFASDPAALPKLLARSAWVDATRAHDAFGYASGALGYKLDLPPHGRRTIDLIIPLSASGADRALKPIPGEAWVARERGAAAAAWREKLNRVSLKVPPVAQPLVDAVRTSLAHILMTRDGPMLRPGTRSYARSWIRDGAMISESLLRLDEAKVAAEFLRWYAPHQFGSGKIPCCVDRRGADPVPENDSAGEFIFLAGEIYRYTHDRALIGAMWPHVAAAVRYLDALRRSERTAANLAPDTRSCYGLLPASISHEGYSEKAMHSYWDDFWALKGYDAAIEIAGALGHDAEARRVRGERDDFRHDLVASLHAAVAAHGIGYLPGAAELGDFDPTSTAIAFAPRGDIGVFPSDLVRATYERYWREFTDRRDGKIAWEAYTPYELRVVGTLVRLGWRDRAQALLAYFLADRRPTAWNQWPEVVGRDPRQPRFVGDMPHAWVASDFIRATLDLFAYERDADRAIVLAAGIAPAWLDQGGVAVRNLRTPYGRLSYTLRRDRGRVTLRLAPGSARPPGGFIFVWPGEKPPRSATINGKPALFSGAELRIGALPASVLIDGR